MRNRRLSDIAKYLNMSRSSKRPRKPKKGDEPERETVESPRPKPLSGGAAAELEFDD